MSKSKSEQDLLQRVEYANWLDVKTLVEGGAQWVIFGIADAKNGFGKPSVSLFCGSGPDKESACSDALEGIQGGPQ